MIFKINKKIVSIILALIFIAIAALFFASYDEPVNSPSAAEVSNPIAGIVKQSGAVVEEKIISPSNKSSSSSQPIPVVENKSGQNQVVQELSDNLIKVTLVAGDRKYDISIEKGATVYDAMTKLSSSNPFSFNAKYYSGLGYFIDAINGIKNANGNYWTLYVNGKYATVGASAYVLSGNENIEWKYTDKTN